MTSDAVAMKVLADLAADDCDDEWPQRGGDGSKELARPLVEIRLIAPAGFDDRPIEVVLGELFKGPRDRALLLVKGAIEVDPVLLFEMKADKGRIRDYFPAVLDIGQLPFWSLAKPCGVGAIGQARHFQ